MSVLVYRYQEVTESNLIRFLKWFQNKFCLRDWSINLDYGDFKPSWVHELYVERAGVMYPEPSFLRGKIWISPSNCKTLNIFPIQVASHEMLHGILSLMEPPFDEVDGHPVINRMEGPLVSLYFLEKGKKLPEVQEFGV